MISAGADACRDHVITKRNKASAEKKRFLSSAAWLKLRKHKLTLVPWCEQCDKDGKFGVPAVDVDHIKPRETHPELELVYSNLQSLCKPCHGRKTWQETLGRQQPSGDT